MRRYRNPCAVPDCQDKTSSRHSFPRKNWGDAFQTWLLRINNPKFKYKNREDITKTSFVCGRHFEENCKIPGSNLLKCLSLPTLNLPNFPQSPSITLKDVWPVGCCDQIDLATPESESNRHMVDNSEMLLNLESFPPDIIYSIQPDRQYEVPVKQRKEDNITVKDTTEIKTTTNLLQKQLNTERHNEETQAISLLQQALEQTDDVFYYKDCISKTSTDVFDLTTDDSILEKPQFQSLAHLLYGDNSSVAGVCRICLRSMDVLEIEQIDKTPQIVDIIKLVLPDLDLDMCPNNIYCARCLELLVYSYELKEKWLATEDKIQQVIKERKNEEKVRKTEAKLGNVLVDINIEPPGEKIRTKRTYIRLKETKYGPGPYQCEKCGEIYVHRKRFQRHLVWHKQNRIKAKDKKEKHMCEICGREFFSMFYFNAHIQKHIEDPDPENYECTNCKKVFNKKVALSNHIKNMHLQQYEYAQCHLCGVKLKSRCSLRQHMKRHSDKKRHQCEVCHKKFIFLNSLRKHEKVHSKEKLLSCEYCGKSIKYEISLKNHIRVFHMDGGKHVCEICKRPYTNKYNLNHHKIRDHGWTFQTPDINVDSES